MSTLSFIVNASMDNSFIECINTDTVGTDVKVGNATVLITGLHLYRMTKMR